MSQSPIKVFLVEDSPVALGMFKRMLESSPEIEVVGTAMDGNQALSLIPQVEPQVICTDLQMPNMDGFELIKQVMAKYPIPVLVISNVVQADDIDNIFQVLQFGALDVLGKPRSAFGDDQESLQRTLITKIKVLATKRVVSKPLV
ncbi:MAG: response regulator [Crocosphaera sp.]|nr:response regulator [Crocosphaera sp.]